MDFVQTRNNISLFYEPIEMPGGYTFSHVTTLKLIDLYYNSKYQSGQYDSRGNLKFFFNVVKPSCDIATKFIDLDTKDVRLIPMDGTYSNDVWLMQKDLKLWMKEKKFGKLLNEIARVLPKYGHVVLKKSKDGIGLTNIQNLRLDPAASSLEMSSFVYEVHNMTAKQIDNMGWDTKELYGDKPEAIYTIYECYDYSRGGWDRTIIGGLYDVNSTEGIRRSTETKYNQKSDYIPGIELSKDTVKELPYRELKFENVEGRWLGLGFVEYLFDNQVAENEAENLERKGLAHKALQLFQTPDETVGGNVFTDAENGDIIKSPSGITPVQKDNSDLAAFNNTRARWQTNSERKTFSFDIARGENLPSRTPLGVANLQAGLVSSYFDIKRENFGMLVSEVIEEDVLPEFTKDMSEKHILVLFGSDTEISKARRLIAEKLLNKRLTELVFHGVWPDEEQIVQEKQRIELELSKRGNIHIDVIKDAYSDIPIKVQIVTTGEQVDTQSRSQTIQFAMQLVATNPMVLQDKGLRTMFFMLLSMNGIPPEELNLVANEVEQNPMMQAVQGGSVAAPNVPVQPQTAQKTQTL